MKRCKDCNRYVSYRTRAGRCRVCSWANTQEREAWVTRSLAQGDELSAEQVRSGIKDLF